MRFERWWAVGSVCLAVLLFVGPGVRQTAAFRYVQVQDPAPHLEVQDLGGTEVKPALLGKLTVLVFWRPGQSFSLEALRDLAGIARELSGRVEILAVATSITSREEVVAFVKQQGYPFPVFIDQERRAQEAYGVIVHPSTGIIGKDGRLLFYQPSRNTNYQAIIGGKLKVALGLMSEQEFEAQLTSLGEGFLGNGKKSQEHYQKGMALFQNGKKEEAARELAQAISIYPEFADAHLELGYVLLEMQETRSALKEFEYVKTRNPMSPSARIGIGIAQLRLGNLEEGIRVLEEAVDVNPNPVRGYAELGRAYEQKGNLDKALYYYKRAIKKLLQGRR